MHPRGVPPLRILIPGLLLAASASAGVRTRALPELPDGVEPALRARAAAVAPASRLHALARVPRGDRAQTEAEGVSLLRSAGGRLWLVSLPAGLALGTEPLPAGVQVWDLGPGDRVVPGLAERLAAMPAGAFVELRVKVFEDERADGVRAAVLAAGGTVRSELPVFGIVDAHVPAAALAELSARDDVRWIEPAPPAPEDANNGLRFDGEVNQVQTLGIDGAGVVIGMWDAGMPDDTHPDLAGRITAGESGMILHPHSTHVAGTAIGDGTNSVANGGTTKQWRGVATAATLVSYTNVGALAEVDSAISLFDIDAANNSWVYPVSEAAGTCSLYGDYSSDAPEFDSIVRGAYGKAIPVVFAAGNERDDGDCGLTITTGYHCLPPPGTAKNVITVGAHNSDQLYMTTFSSWGPTDDGRMKPDLSAPGCEVFGDFGITSTAIGGGYLSMCGTSMAAPAVTGSVAALIEEWRARFSGDPRPATCKALLGNFAKDRANAGPDYRFGMGALNLYASVTALQTATTVEDAVDDAQTDTFPFFVAASAGTLQVTLAWDDPVAAELADPTLVNDLDLELIGPTTGTWQAFVLDPANPDSLAVPGSNRRDNVEQVRVLAPESGWWEARVTGYSVPQGPQDYSLAGFDNRAPADPAAFVATAAGDTTVTLTWIRPGDTDRAGTLVVRSSSPVSWVPEVGVSYSQGAEPTPGVVVLAADDVDHQATPLADEPLAPGTTFHYAAFAYDEIPNYSPGVADSAATTSIAVDVPAVSVTPAVPRFLRQGANPVRDVARFRFELPAPAMVAADVYDVSGRHVARLVEGPRKAGTHLLEWDGRADGGEPLRTGVYFVRFRTPGLTAVEKVVLVR